MLPALASLQALRWESAGNLVPSSVLACPCVWPCCLYSAPAGGCMSTCSLSPAVLASPERSRAGQPAGCDIKG